MYCQNCRNEIPDGSRFCPACGFTIQPNVNFQQPAQNNFYPPTPPVYQPPAPKKKNHGCLVAFITVALIFVAIFTISIILASDTTSGTEQTTNETNQSQQDSSADSSELIYEDAYVKVSFIKLYTIESVNEAVYLQLLVENKTQQTVTVGLTNSAVNGMSTVISSGFPMTILPGNSSQQPFIIHTKNTNVVAAEDIEKLQFSVYLLDEDINTIEETDVITIKIN